MKIIFRQIFWDWVVKKIESIFGCVGMGSEVGYCCCKDRKMFFKLVVLWCVIVGLLFWRNGVGSVV